MVWFKFEFKKTVRFGSKQLKPNQTETNHWWCLVERSVWERGVCKQRGYSLIQMFYPSISMVLPVFSWTTTIRSIIDDVLFKSNVSSPTFWKYNNLTFSLTHCVSPAPSLPLLLCYPPAGGRHSRLYPPPIITLTRQRQPQAMVWEVYLITDNSTIKVKDS